MLWGGPCDSEGLPIATLCTGRLGPPAMPTAPSGSHRLAFNPFCLGEFLGPSEMGSMKTRGWEGVPVAPRAHSTWGLHDVALSGPAAILDECQPRLGHHGLARWGLCFLLCPGACGKVCTQWEKGTEREKERGEESPDHLQSQPHPSS